MKVAASVEFQFQAGSLGEAGALLDELLQRAREREEVEIAQVNVTAPPRYAPVTLPALSAIGQPLPREPQLDGP